MRISDWSSDVCSSDLPHGLGLGDAVRSHRAEEAVSMSRVTGDTVLVDAQQQRVAVAVDQHLLQHLHLPGGFALAPQRLARARPVADPPGADDRKRTRLNSSHYCAHRMPSSARNQITSEV